jgi:hypothetical protein
LVSSWSFKFQLLLLHQGRTPSCLSFLKSVKNRSCWFSLLQTLLVHLSVIHFCFLNVIFYWTFYLDIFQKKFCSHFNNFIFCLSDFFIFLSPPLVICLLSLSLSLSLALSFYLSLSLSLSLFLSLSLSVCVSLHFSFRLCLSIWLSHCYPLTLSAFSRSLSLSFFLFY